jgi:transposase-like protein
MRELAAEFRLGHWAQIMQDRADSGMSIRAYCKANGIGTNVYHYWQRKLREAAAQQLAAAEPEKVQQALIPSGWAQVTEEAEPEPQSLTLRVNGVEIQIQEGFDEALLASVCRALQC